MSLDRKLSQLTQSPTPAGTAETYLVEGGQPRRAPLSGFPVSNPTENRIVEAVAEGLSSVGTNKIYADFAEANADLGNIANLEFVTVIADENFEGRRAVYRKEGGVLVNRYVEDEQDTSDFPHLSQNKSQPYWITKLLAESGVLVQATPSLLISPKQGKYSVEGDEDTFANAVTYTRADAVATKFHASGKLATVGVDTPQFEYDPETGERYLLLEPSRTNLLTYSEAFSNSAWIKSGPTITANAEVAPDGTTTADVADGSGFIRQNVSAPTAPICISVFAKRISGSGKFFLDYGDVDFTEFNATDTWQRFTYTTDDISGAAGNFVDIAPDAAGEIAFWGAQLEEGSYPTSYIKTVASSVARSAPSTTVPVGEWFNQNKGTFFCEMEISSFTNVTPYLFDTGESPSTAAGRISARVAGGDLKVFVNNGALSQDETVFQNLTAGDRIRFAISYDGTEFIASLNGESYSFSGITLSSADLLHIAQRESVALNTTKTKVYELRYRPDALTAAQLVALTGA